MGYWADEVPVEGDEKPAQKLNHTVWIRGEMRPEVRGRNWLIALGEALADSGDDKMIARLACEVLGNGTVIAVNGDTGERYVISLPELDDDAMEPLTEEVRLR